MKVIRSKGGYYYKVYKNGKKKRISKDLYLKLLGKAKKTKSVKTQKRISTGGGGLGNSLRGCRCCGNSAKLQPQASLSNILTNNNGSNDEFNNADDKGHEWCEHCEEWITPNDWENHYHCCDEGCKFVGSKNTVIKHEKNCPKAANCRKTKRAVQGRTRRKAAQQARRRVAQKP
tara:strand:- start:2691 stop:3212 length:522 start_codon:yes stop_codon:yes gene_type:complete